jgi:transposase
MRRHALTDEQWALLSLMLPTQRPGPASKLGDRYFIDAVLYRAKAGIPWRDLPEHFGPWKTVYNRFANWADRGVWGKVFKALQLDVDPTGSILDGSVIRAHQDSSGAKGGSSTMLWVAPAEDSRPTFTPSRTSRATRSMSR